MHVFVTGGSGFVGGHLIRALRAHGHEVSAMARSARSAARVEALGARSVRTDLASVTSESLAGVDAVIHAAAFVEEYGRREDYAAANIEGTRALLDAARSAGASRFVLVSTNAAVFEPGPQLGVDEAQPYPTTPAFPYGWSKAEAERLTLAADAPGFTTVAIRPCFVWGEGDTSVLPALRRMADDGSFVWLDGGRAEVSTTHVHNLVDALLVALERGRGGEAYFVADADDTDMRGFIGGLATSEGIDLPVRSVPGGVVRAVARVLEFVWRALDRRSPPPVTYMAALLMSSSMTVRSDKAQRELGWTPRVTRAEGLARLRGVAGL
jgi:nucleoside-diphosphate-sugar epimerase